MTISLSSCQNKQNKTQEEQFDIYKTFVNVTKEKDKYILYKPCNADILEFEIKKDNTVNQKTNQDGVYKYSLEKVNYLNNTTAEIIVNQFYPSIYKDTIRISKVDNIWNINDRYYVYYENKTSYSYKEQPCHECFDSSYCNSIKLKNILKKNWQGKYHFSLENLARMGETHNIYFDFDISDVGNPKIISQLDDNAKKVRNCEVTHITKDTLVLMDIKKNDDIYILSKDKENNYNIGGSVIYMLNPPNKNNPLIKE